MTDQLSRPASRVTVRAQVLTWLREHADLPVRFLIAPPGFGKSTALAAYTAGRPHVTLALDGRLTAREFTAAVARAVAAAGPRPPEIVLDDVHLANVGVLRALQTLVADAPDDVHLIVSAQRRDIFDIGALFARGRAAVCDQAALALDAHDAAALFAAHGLDPEPAASAELVARTGGWPSAIAGTLRERLRDGASTDTAYDRWRRGWSVPALDLVNTLLDRLAPADQAAARRHFAGGTPLDGHTLAQMHRCGFFVNFDGGAFALMPWVEELFPTAPPSRVDRPVMEVTLFGRFSAGVNGVPIVWARRRDQQIIKFLLLRPDGSATRAELTDAFWPHTARPLAMQNLRTACSTIRRAIANVVGPENVDAYLIAGDRLAVNRTTIVTDVDRFGWHVASAEAEDGAGALAAAIVHLRSAERLFGNGLFAGDISEPAFAAEAKRLEGIYGRVLARLSGALIERGSPDTAREYAAKALKRGLFAAGASGAHVHLRFATS